jgi:hypothetical protein
MQISCSSSAMASYDPLKEPLSFSGLPYTILGHKSLTASFIAVKTSLFIVGNNISSLLRPYLELISLGL